MASGVQVERIREQCTKQEETIKEQSTELDAKKSELQALKDEETALETEQKNSSTELEKMTTSLQETQLQISQVTEREREKKRIVTILLVFNSFGASFPSLPHRSRQCSRSCKRTKDK